jgi:hypothetical protein
VKPSNKKSNKNADNGFVPIRRGLYEHINDGRMTGKELMVYTTLHLKADHLTGICYKVSRVALGLFLKESTNNINRIMSSLERKGYIKRLSHRGQIRYYPVIINKYLTSSGILIDASKTKSLNEICWYVEEDCTLTAQQMHTLQYIKNIRRLKTKTKRPSKGGKSKTFYVDSTEFKLAKLLYDTILNRKPDYKQPNLQEWACHIDLMIRRDNRKSERITEVIQWCQADSGDGGNWKGWQDIILSTRKLREKFDQLELSMKKKGKIKNADDSGDITGSAKPYIR